MFKFIIMLKKQYQFLETIGPLPKIVDAGLQFIGVKEFPGKNDNVVIMKMASDLGISNIYKNDEMAWCALFICYLLWLTKKPMLYKQYEVLRASSFIGLGSTLPKAWGEPVELYDVSLGDIIVFKRSAGYHVGIAIAVTRNISGAIRYIHVLGGNQSNTVSIAEFSVDRVAGIRRFYATGKPVNAITYTITSTGVLSTDES